jgi:Flp pilus assembly protein TadG
VHPRQWLDRFTRDERGVTFVLIGLLMVSLLGMAALVLDAGRYLEARRQLQNAVDAAAHAAAQDLPDTVAAADSAEFYFWENEVNLGASAVEVTFPTAEHERVQVEGTVEIAYVFAPILGFDTGTVTARAVVGAQPADIMMVLDRSGSMCEDSHYATANCPPAPPVHEPMNSVRNAAVDFSEFFSPGYARLGLVSYSTTATLDMPLGTDFGPGSSYEDEVLALMPGGSTNIGDSIEEARLELVANGREDARGIIVLLSDGVANRCAGGVSCTASAAGNYARARAEAAAADGLVVYTIGLGEGVDEDLMQDIADAGSGIYVYSPTKEDLEGTFEEIAKALRTRFLE